MAQQQKLNYRKTEKNQIIAVKELNASIFAIFFNKNVDGYTTASTHTQTNFNVAYFLI